MKKSAQILCLLLMLTLLPLQAFAACTATACGTDCTCGCDTNGIPPTPWDGTSSDTSWYDASATTFTITTAAQLAGLSELSAAGTTFEGKIVKLGADIDLGGKNFEPINYFAGTFDGDGHTISNLSISTNLIATLSERYIGLFREVNNGTVKNLTMDNAQLIPYWDAPWEHYQCEMGIVASKTYGTCTFENIKVMNSSAMTYNNTVGGVVGEAYGDITFKNVQVDASNTFGAYWQSHDSCTGGILGYAYANLTVTFDNCVSAPVMDVYNDVQANYQYYLYRYSGMLIGNVRDPGTITVKATGTTVGFGDWNQYKWCEFQELGHGSYNGPDEWKYTRTDSGNSLVAPGHTHRDFEDHELLLPFEQLTGRATGGTPDYTLPGVTIENKAYYFVIADNAEGSGIYPEGSTVTLTSVTCDCCEFTDWEIIADDSSSMTDKTASPAKVTVKGLLHVEANYGDVAVEPEEDKAPVTGDESHLYLWMLLLAAAVLTGVTTLKVRGKAE